MSTTTLTHPAAFARTAAPAARPAKPGLWARVWNALAEGGRRRAEREIGAFIESRGGRTTDSLERDIERYCEMRGLR